MLGRSPTGFAESSSLALRTVLSPQVALHPPSRERSYHCRIQGGNVNLTGTSTLLFNRLHRRTSEIRLEFRWTPLDVALLKVLAAFATYKGKML